MRTARGFTMIELMAVMAIMALLVSLVAPRYFSTVSRSEETALKSNLAQMRDAIDKFYSDQGRYPSRLDELVAAKYLRKIPVDPMTKRHDSWVVVPPAGGPAGAVFDVRSGFDGRGRDGTEVATW